MGARVTIAPATAQLSQKGMMIIQGAGNKPTEVIPPPPPSYGKMKKRGKLANHSRRQMLHKQKAVMDKMLNVNHRIEDLHHLLNEMGEQMSSGAGDAGVSLNISQATKQTRPSYQGIPLTMSQDFYLPLMARSVGLPAIPQGLQIQGTFDHQPTRTEDAKKKVGPAEPAKERANEQETPQLPGMNVANALWQRKNSVAKFSSQNVIRKSFSEHEAKFPLLNISHILKVRQ
ncbi:uncharacterized protein [Montipora foliosa]|uniref:uncharacterized protein n=1 Tax=Montipora foliosa TaxID=591990 RepID=UPI0035F14390